MSTSITITPEPLNRRVADQVAKALTNQHKGGAAHHHKKTIVEEEWSSDEEEVVVSKKGTKKESKKKEGGKKNKSQKSNNGLYTATKLKHSIEYGCDCTTRAGEECEKPAWYRITGHTQYRHACAQHWSMLKEGKHIGVNAKKVSVFLVELFCPKD